jgi:hypothetical protein
MVDELLRGDEGKRGRLRAFRRRHAVHARPRLFQKETDVIIVDERGDVVLLLKAKEERPDGKNSASRIT